MTKYKPVACADYDVLEVVCMYRYEVDLTLDDEHIVGTAITLESESGAEYLSLDLDAGDRVKIRIDRIRRLVVNSRPARLVAHTFAFTPQ